MYTPLRRNIERRVSLTDAEWQAITEKAEFVTLKKHQFLQVQDSNCAYEGFILKGAFKIYIINEDGTESILFFSFENDWMCDLESFYHQKPTKYNIKAIEDSEVIVITKSNKTLLFKKVPKLLHFHILMVERANVLIQERLLDALNKTVKQRYMEFLKKYPHKTRYITNKNLSSYFGVSHEFLSKIKKTI